MGGLSNAYGNEKQFKEFFIFSVILLKLEAANFNEREKEKLSRGQELFLKTMTFLDYPFFKFLRPLEAL